MIEKTFIMSIFIHDNYLWPIKGKAEIEQKKNKLS